MPQLSTPTNISDKIPNQTDVATSFQEQRPASDELMNAQSSSTADATASHSMTKTTSTKLEINDEIAKLVYAVLNDTGLSGRELFRCAQDCTATADDENAFKMHMMAHDRESLAGYRCYHCNVCLKTILSLLKHIASHARHCVFCIFCDYTCIKYVSMKQHMCNTHKKYNLQSIQLNNISGNKTMLVYPRNPPQQVIRAFKDRIINRYQMIEMQRNQRNVEKEVNALVLEADR